jgi:hypothetical protein
MALFLFVQPLSWQTWWFGVDARHFNPMLDALDKLAAMIGFHG